MKRVFLASASVLPVALALGGCYWLASYADLTSGVGGGEAGGDASLPPTQGEDAGPPVDTGIVVVDAADATVLPGPFCPPDAGPYSYCMAFDGVDASALGLGNYQASVGIVSTESVSPPSSMSVSLYTGPGSSGGYSVGFPFEPRTSRLEFEIMVVAPDVWVTTLAINIDYASAATGENLNVIVTPTGQFQVQEYFALPDGGNLQDGHLTPGLDGGAEAGAWHHVVLSLTTDDGAQQYLDTLTVDGQILEDQQPLGLPWAQGTAGISVGVTYGGAGGSGSQFFFDNVRADFGL